MTEQKGDEFKKQGESALQKVVGLDQANQSVLPLRSMLTQKLRTNTK
jgi:hypothetical protein